METLHKIEHWADNHRPVWIDVLRIILGIYLVIKGIIFISDTDALFATMRGAGLYFLPMAVVHYVAYVHIIGGVFIAVGLLTRFAVLLQLPILLGAVFLVNPPGPSFEFTLEFWISLVVLLLLFVFLIYGSGRLSVTGYGKTHPQ
jgi:putative oxidoreductase